MKLHNILIYTYMN